MKLKVLLPIGLFMLLMACSPSTQLISSWADPSITPGTIEPFNKVMVIARIKDETQNRIAEDKIVASIKAAAVPSYSVLVPGDTNAAAIDAKLMADGIDGMIVMKLTEVNKTLNYTPPTYSGGYYGGYGYGGYYGYRGYYGYGYSSPGYVSEDQTFYVETSIYSLTSGKMLWAGTTSTLNPKQLDETIDDIINAVEAELIRKGLISE